MAVAEWPVTKIATNSGKTLYRPWRALLVTAIFTGMRASELRGLLWSDVDLKAGVIHVRRRADLWGQIGAPKSKAGRRDIPLSPMVITTLREWKVASPPHEMNLVFPSRRLRPLTHPNVVNQGLTPLLEECGLVDQPYTFHSLRHAAASLFIDQGWSPKKVQKVMGHSSIQVTFDIYGHLFPSQDDDLKAMADLETRLLGGG
jgi:integrase